jgi:hypothetical protein
MHLTLPTGSRTSAPRSRCRCPAWNPRPAPGLQRRPPCGCLASKSPPPTVATSPKSPARAAAPTGLGPGDRAHLVGRVAPLPLAREVAPCSRSEAAGGMADLLPSRRRATTSPGEEDQPPGIPGRFKPNACGRVVLIIFAVGREPRAVSTPLESFQGAGAPVQIRPSRPPRRDSGSAVVPAPLTR